MSPKRGRGGSCKRGKNSEEGHQGIKVLKK